MVLSLSNGTPTNIIRNREGTYDILEQEKERILGFIGLMANMMGWRAMPDKWNFSNMELYKFKKESMSSVSGGTAPRLNQDNYKSMVEGDCFSMAITAGTTIEYTRDVNGFFRQ